MKNKLKLRSLAFLATSPLVVISLSTNAFAASLEWAGSSTGLATGTSDTWDTATTANWSDGIGLVNWPAPGGTDDDAVFGGTAGTVTITSATANDISFSTTGYTLTGATLTLNGTAPTISNGDGIDATVSSVIDGSSGLVKTGGGALTLSAVNLFSGGTTLSGGTVIAANDSAFGSGSIVMNDARLRSGVGPDTNLANAIQIAGANSVFEAPIGSNLKLNGNLTGDGNAAATGQWAVSLGGDNSGFTGVWTSGSENPNNITAFASASGGSASAEWVLNGGRMINAASGTTTISLGSLAGGGGILSNNVPGDVTFSVGGLNIDTTFNGQIQNEWGGGGTTAIIKVGSGNWTLGGNNSYSGGTTISGGTLTAGNDSAFGSGGIVLNDARLRSGVGPDTNLANAILIAGTNSVLEAPIGSNLKLNGNLTGDGNVAAAGQWAVSLGGDNSGFTGTWTSGSENPNNLTAFASANGGSASAEWVLNGGRMVNATNGTPTIHLGSLAGTGGILSNNVSGQVTFSIGGLDTDTTFSGLIQNEWGGGGTTAIAKVGNGTLTLAGGNSYSGGTTISSGAIIAANNSALGSGTVVMSGGALRAGVGPDTNLANNIQIDGSGIVLDAPLSSNLGLNGNLSGSGSVSVAGQWAVSLGGDNSGFTGVWTSGSESPNNLTSFASANGGSASAEWVLNGGRMVNGNNSSPTISLGSLSGTGGILSNNVPGVVTFNIGALNTDTTFGGQIDNAWGGGGTTAIAKVGTGKLTLTGTNNYSGATSVSGGTLAIDGSLGTTTVTVNSAELAGNGTLGGAVTLETGGNLATRISDWTGSGGTGFDDLNVQSLTIQGGTPHVITLDTTGLVNFSESAATFPILVTTDGITSFSAGDFTVSAPGFPGTGTWAVQQNVNQLELVYTPASGSPYDTWGTDKGLTIANNAKGLDPDNDGLTNLQEFALDGNPLGGANDGKQVSVLADPDGAGPETTALILTIPVRNGAVFNGPGDLVSDPVDGIVYQIQGSSDLVDFTTMNISEVSPALDSGLPVLSAGWTYRSFRTPGPLGVREFIRTAVVENP